MNKASYDVCHLGENYVIDRESDDMGIFFIFLDYVNTLLVGEFIDIRMIEFDEVQYLVITIPGYSVTPMIKTIKHLYGILWYNQCIETLHL
jgi:hypothetical protein